MTVRDVVIARAAEQHGYVTAGDAREIGVDPTQLRLMAARGHLERIGRGAYRVPILPRTEHDELAEAVAWTQGRGVVSHESALELLGLSDVSPSRIHLTVPRDNHPRGTGGDLYRMHRRTLNPAAVTEHDGIPVTTSERTILDCLATGTDPYQLRRAVDEAEAEGMIRRTTAEALRARIGGNDTQPRGKKK
jgi:predicted transcriptional regulator of viral defense system